MKKLIVKNITIENTEKIFLSFNIPKNLKL